jgi:hypothetical protein
VAGEVVKGLFRTSYTHIGTKFSTRGRPTNTYTEAISGPIHKRNYTGGGRHPYHTYAGCLWSDTAKTAGGLLILSNNNQTVTRTGASGGVASVRGTRAYTTGLRSFRIVGSSVSRQSAIGFITSGYDLEADWLGNNNTGVAWWNDGSWNFDFFNVGGHKIGSDVDGFNIAGGSYTADDILDIEYNRSALGFYKNGVLVLSRSLPIAWFAQPSIYPAFYSETAGDKATANFLEWN